MKTALFLIFLMASANTAHAQSQTLEWSCPSIDYDDKNVAGFPSKAKLKLTMSGSQVELSPNIFEEDSGFFSRKADYVVNIEDCVKDLESSLTGQVKTSFKNFLKDQDLIKKQKTSSVPRFYPGHRFKKVGASKAAKEYRLFCSGKNFDPVTITSQDFLAGLSELIDNPLADLKSACLEKLNAFNDAHSFKNCSEDSICHQIREDQEVYNSRFKDLSEKRTRALAFARQVEEDFNPYRLSSNKTKRSIKDKLSEKDLEAGTSVNKTFKVGNYTDDMFYYDDAIQEAMPEIQAQDRRYQEKFLEGYVATKFFNQDPLETDYCQKNPCEEAKEAKAIFHDNVAKLLKALYGNNAQAACFDVDQMKDKNLRIEDLLDDIKKVSECSEVAVGETKVVAGVVTSTPSNYALTRINENTLKSTIVMKFIDGKHGTQVSSDQMFKRAQNCLKTTSTYFRSNDGETILVDLITEEEAKKRPISERPATQEVEIMPANHRAHSRAYDEDISCQTITHEVLHLMGLCDEYKETAKKRYVDTSTGKILNKPQDEIDKLVQKGKAKEDGNKYQCRAFATVDSIMSRQRDVMNSAMGASVTCECKNQKCKDLLSYPQQKVRNLMLKDYTSGLSAFDFCEYKDAREIDVKTLGQLNSLPEAQIISQSANSFKYRTTDIQTSFSGHLAVAIPYTVSCSCIKLDCQDDFKELKRRIKEKDPVPNKGCPSRLAKTVSREDLEYAQAQKNEIIQDGGLFTLKSKAERPNMSLLRPAHFERIKYGTCSDKAKTYTQCMKYAYKDECPDRPAACKDVNQWLLSTK